MEYRLGNSKRIHATGETNELICPCCNKEVKLGVFSNIDFRLIAKMPLVDINTIYFLICPECASIYTAKSQTDEKFTKHNILFVNAEELTPLDEFSPKI